MSASPACPICGAETVPERGFGDHPLHRCASCDFMLLHAETDLQALYADRYFEAYGGEDYLEREQQRRKESRIRLDLLARVQPAPARIVELGSAAGFFLDEARMRGYEGVGIEPNAAMAARARDAMGLDVRTGVLRDAGVEAGSFDAACAFHVVEHLDDPVAELRALGEVLRPGGHLLVEVPNVASAVARARGAAWPALDIPHHVGHHGPRSLRTLLTNAGYDVLLLDTIPFAVYGAGSRPHLLALSASETLRVRAVLPAGPHPSGHQLLRAVARRR